MIFWLVLVDCLTKSSYLFIFSFLVSIIVKCTWLACFSPKGSGNRQIFHMHGESLMSTFVSVGYTKIITPLRFLNSNYSLLYVLTCKTGSSCFIIEILSLEWQSTILCNVPLLQVPTLESLLLLVMILNFTSDQWVTYSSYIRDCKVKMSKIQSLFSKYFCSPFPHCTDE